MEWIDGNGIRGASIWHNPCQILRSLVLRHGCGRGVDTGRQARVGMNPVEPLTVYYPMWSVDRFTRGRFFVLKKESFDSKNSRIISTVKSE